MKLTTIDQNEIKLDLRTYSDEKLVYMMKIIPTLLAEREAEITRQLQSVQTARKEIS